MFALFTAGYVLRSLKLTCDVCISDISTADTHMADNRSRDDATLIGVKNRGGLVTPHPRVHTICVATEKTIRYILTCQGLPATIHRLVTNRTLGYVLLNNIHQTFTCASHSTSLVKDIITRYSLIRIRHETTKSVQQDNLRQKLHKLVIFSHT